jgi:hypothetical protein
VPDLSYFRVPQEFIEAHSGGAINYAPFNSALTTSGKIDVNKIWDYYA